MTSETAEFYKNKNVFITGGTGFLGIAIIEKLLRTTPEVFIIKFFFLLFSIDVIRIHLFHFIRSVKSIC